MTVILTGFMGTGKSTIGRIVAKKLGFKFVDSDNLIEAKAEKSIKNIFEEDGEESFRLMESEIIESITEDNIVLSTGGGAVISESNRNHMKNLGLVVTLTAKVDDIVSRVVRNDERPLLKGEDLKELVTDKLNKRKAFYDEADLTVDTSLASAVESADFIIKFLENNKK